MKNKTLERIKKTILFAGLPLALALSIAGCVSVGQPFNSNHVSGITIGKTTQADIEKMFGSPFRTGVEDGDVTWTYLDYHFGLGKQSTADLYVRFTADGKVKSYAFNSN